MKRRLPGGGIGVITVTAALLATTALPRRRTSPQGTAPPR